VTKIVLAHYRKAKLLRSASFIALILAGGIWLIFISHNGHFLSLVRAKSNISFLMILFGMTGLLYYLWTEILLVKQALFDRFEAVWIDGDRIVYLGKRYSSAKLEDVAAVSTDNYGSFNFPMIVLRLRNGEERYIPTGALIEDRSSIVAEINARLSQ